MHTFARAISRHRCHRGGSQEPEEQPASKHSQSCWESLGVQLRELSCSVWQRWSTAPARGLLGLHAPFQGSSSLTPALQTHNTQQE